ncbi:hypothetical protein BPAE_0174g00040 [Botrytis paeoniae]|uniref:Zn(2)-C6 fungal-type domain-containing protein n=1 Tax=Botrytis paeoniae TaxID=278948 RepID=A0A4Z1FI43_9HELO|nr:hypothetical protein BPAE_0174g00040 [Botrytis paeoniae]
MDVTELRKPPGIQACRILGKKCTEENPCDTCPKRNKAGKTAWAQIGCKRGTLSQEIESIDLCPKSRSQPMPSGIDIFCLQCRRHWCQSTNPHESRCPRCQIIDAKVIGPFTSDLKNNHVEEAARRRKKDVVSFTEGEDTITELSLAIAALRQNISLENFGRPPRPLSLAGAYFPNQASMPSLIALDQCSMAIVCLMSAIKRYIDQLSKVFFKKENLRGKTWWLSVFYSLLIQSLVRAIMKAIVGDDGAVIPPGRNQYLHLAVRLFRATSGAHDPLARSIPVQGSRRKALAGCDSCKRRKLKCAKWRPSCEACQDFQGPCIYGGKLEIDDSEIEDYNVASLSVQQEKWQSYGLNSSGDFLQHLFQDDGQLITHEAAINNEPQTTNANRHWIGH